MDLFQSSKNHEVPVKSGNCWGFAGGFCRFLAVPQHKQRLLRVSSLISLIELSTYLPVMIRSVRDIYFMATSRRGGTELMESTQRGARERGGPSAGSIAFHSWFVTWGGIRIWKPHREEGDVDEGLALNSN